MDVLPTPDGDARCTQAITQRGSGRVDDTKVSTNTIVCSYAYAPHGRADAGSLQCVNTVTLQWGEGAASGVP